MRPAVKAWLPYAALAVLTAVALAAAAERVGWRNLLLTPDQRGRLLMDHGRPGEAADAFRDPIWRGVALYQSGDFKTAAQAFAAADNADASYDQGNALVMLGKYDDAVKSYDRALALRPGWPEATVNRRIASVRAERMKQEGGPPPDPSDQEDTPDQVVFDKTKKGGADTTVEGEVPAMSDAAVRAMWLKRVQTRPADFLRVKFAYQLQPADAGAKP